MLVKQDSFPLSYFTKALGTLNEILQLKENAEKHKTQGVLSRAFSKDSSSPCFLMTLLLLNVKYSFLWVHWATGFNRNERQWELLFPGMTPCTRGLRLWAGLQFTPESSVFLTKLSSKPYSSRLQYQYWGHE